MAGHTIELHRVLSAAPDKVLRAFLDADAWAQWAPPDGFVGAVQQMEAREGGTFRMSFRNFSSGATHSFGGTFEEIVPGQRLVYTDRFDDPNLPGEIRVSVSVKAVTGGTELTIVQAGVPEVIPASLCVMGWQQSLTKLARLVEPEIP